MTIGERVGDYEVLQVLGAGGMGEVYKVRNLVSDRIEAMKVLLPALCGDADLLCRFQREIKVQAALAHPNIASLYTAQLVGRDLIMVMEYVEGTSLEKSLKEGPLRCSDSVTYAIQVLDALGYAHSCGVVHRDIKPANIMRTTAGVIKLMDFGIARMKADQRLTRTGHVVGSLFYMSPEQIRGSQPDPRSDIYSFGVSLYEMITGSRPFQGDSDFSLMAAHLQQMPRPPFEIVPGVSAELSDVILKALAKEPAERFQTAEEFRAALGPAEAFALRAGVGAAFAADLGAQPCASAASAGAGVGSRRPPARRGLYMALGSAVTVIVLAAAVIEGPRLLRSGASGAATRQPVDLAGSAPALSPVPSVSRSSSALVSAPGSTEAVPPTRPGVVPAPPRGWRNASRALAQQRGQGGPTPEAERKSLQWPQPVEAQLPKDAVPGIPNDLRDRLVSLQARIAAYSANLETLTNQLKGQGLALRPELSEAVNEARIRVGAAESEMASGAFVDARKSLDAAEVAVQRVGKAYGR